MTGWLGKPCFEITPDDIRIIWSSVGYTIDAAPCLCETKYNEVKAPAMWLCKLDRQNT